MITLIVHVTSFHVICNVLNYLIKIIFFFRETKFFGTCEENSLRVVENLNHQKIFHIYDSLKKHAESDVIDQLGMMDARVQSL